MNAILNAYKNGAAAMEVARYPEERVYRFRFMADGQILEVECDTSEERPEPFTDRPYICNEVYFLNAHYRGGADVHFTDEDESVFTDLAADYLNSVDGEVDEHHPVPSGMREFIKEYIHS